MIRWYQDAAVLDSGSSRKLHIRWRMEAVCSLLEEVERERRLMECDPYSISILSLDEGNVSLEFDEATRVGLQGSALQWKFWNLGRPHLQLRLRRRPVFVPSPAERAPCGRTLNPWTASGIRQASTRWL
eukprot:CAMPEP_0180812868 /NCGR_PEP_ID=MMETSP1038_2-20121128/66237_1 /TAXON_ID=632150 /ORGANISM="Azadinium spinosum, Strain 3D9" /LENGTH=128 /DNA_ID=CAMNT_0022854433 /DNA_START=251 /DNA_END=638 /DNA_ORIENTATION=-